jgi:hypothetical protein
MAAGHVYVAGKPGTGAGRDGTMPNGHKECDRSMCTDSIEFDIVTADSFFAKQFG